MTQRRGWQISAESPLNEREAAARTDGRTLLPLLLAWESARAAAAARSEFTTLSLLVYEGAEGQAGH